MKNRLPRSNIPKNRFENAIHNICIAFFGIITFFKVVKVINDFKVFKEQNSSNYNNEKPTSIDRGRLHFCLQQVFYFWNFMV